MEEEDSTEEKTMRFGIKSTAKGFYYADWTVRADSIEEIKAKSEELRQYALDELKKLNPNI